MATKEQVAACIAKIAPLAQEQYRKGKHILPSVCIAQACCESAYLTSKKMIDANAVFGIKVGSKKIHFGTAWKDKAYSTKTMECYDGKTYTQITDMFRAYDTLAESVEDYYDMIMKCSRYAGAIGENDSTKAITAIKNGGYATSPTYISTITGIIKKYNLTQYDNINSTPAQEEQTEKEAINYVVGENYTLYANMYIRDEANGNKKKYTALTTNAKTHAYKDKYGYGILKSGTVVTIKETKTTNGVCWVRIPSGWVCGYSGRVYIK